MDIPAFTGLEQVVRWALARDLPIRVVAMDEYTYDIVIPVRPDLVWVFDSD